jgi:hypothetical protein
MCSLFRYLSEVLSFRLTAMSKLFLDLAYIRLTKRLPRISLRCLHRQYTVPIRRSNLRTSVQLLSELIIRFLCVFSGVTCKQSTNQRLLHEHTDSHHHHALRSNWGTVWLIASYLARWSNFGPYAIDLDGSLRFVSVVDDHPERRSTSPENHRERQALESLLVICKCDKKWRFLILKLRL